MTTPEAGTGSSDATSTYEAKEAKLTAKWEALVEKAEAAEAKIGQWADAHHLNGEQKAAQLTEKWQQLLEKVEAVEGKLNALIEDPDHSERKEARLAEKLEKLIEKADAAEARIGELAENHQLKGEMRQAQLTEKWQNLVEKAEAAEAKLNDWIEENGPTEPEPISYDASTNTYTVAIGVSAEDLNVLIAEAPPGATIFLCDGTHEFSETLIIARDDISLIGESESGTVFNFTFPHGTGGNAIEVMGGAKSEVTSLSQSAEEGATTIILADTSDLAAGDVIYISQPNTEEYLLENGWDNVSMDDAEDRPFREFIVRVEEIDGDIVTLSSPLPYTFDPDETTVSTIDLLEGVTLGFFTVTSGIDGEPNYFDFVNTHPEFEDTAVILINGADGISLTGISILDAPSNAFEFRTTLDLMAHDIYVNGAHNLGGGGNGYGIELAETFGATISDAEIYNVRHALLFSSWSAETGNFIGITATNRDVNFHGSPDLGNVIIVGQGIMNYDTSQDTSGGNGYWDIVGEGGSKHANTGFYDDNSVVFSYAEGSDGSETIFGADGGAFLDGNGSQDVIYGGAGDDLLMGGTSRDWLTGGGGSDIFAFAVGDAYDTIRDFDAGDDSILLFGHGHLADFAALEIWQDGADTYVRYGSNSTIILSDFTAGDLTADNFIFDASQQHLLQLQQDYLLAAG
ncbi:MAG: hypothetical protein AAFR71_07080 [Pseudomonadota bacterium]